METIPESLSKVFIETDPDVVYMEPTGLLNLIKEKCTSFFVMDVRDSNDFKSSHVKYVHWSLVISTTHNEYT
jgi:hypothetical protein